MRATLNRFLLATLDFRSIGRAAAVVALPVALYALTANELWLLAVLVTISLQIGIERVGLAPVGVLAQAAAILAGFLLLTLCANWRPAFVAACASLAAAAVALSLGGARLRSLGNFVFIPSLYLACETAGALAQARSLMPYMAVAALPPLALACDDVLRTHRTPEGARALSRWRRPCELGAPAHPEHAAWSIVGVALSVALAATLVEWGRLPHGQWVIWSAASVVTGTPGAAGSKLRDRVLGVLLGVPLGLATGFILPRCTFVYALIGIVSPLTLVAFRHYATSFAVRCACIACLSWIAQQSAAAATDRIANVMLGGLIGVVCVFFVSRIPRRC